MRWAGGHGRPDGVSNPAMACVTAQSIEGGIASLLYAMAGWASIPKINKKGPV